LRCEFFEKDVAPEKMKRVTAMSLWVLYNFGSAAQAQIELGEQLPDLGASSMSVKRGHLQKWSTKQGSPPFNDTCTNLTGPSQLDIVAIRN